MADTSAGRGSFAGGAAFGILSVAVVGVVALGGSIVTARLYGIEVLGAFALAYAPAAICAALSTMQEQVSLSRELATLPPRAPRITGMFAAVQAFSTLLTLAVALVVGALSVVLFHGPIGEPQLVAPALAMLAGYLVVENTNWNLDVIFAAFRAGRTLFRIRLMTAVAFIALAVGLAEVTDTVWGLVGAQVGSMALALVWRIVAVRAHMRLVVPRAELRRARADLPDMVRTGSRLAPAFIGEGVAHEAGTWILGMTSSVAAVGAWSRAWMLGRRLLEPGARVGEMLLPTLVERRAHGRPGDFDRTLVDTTRYMAIGMLLPAAVLGGAAESVMDLFGPGFDRAAPAFAVLLLVPVLYCVVDMMLLGQVAVGRSWNASLITLARCAVMIGAGAALSVPYGIDGMAIGYVAGYAVDLAWRTAATARIVSRPLHELWPLRSFVAIAVAYPAGLLAARSVDVAIAGHVALLVALPAGALAYAAAYLLVGGVTPTDRVRLGAVRARLRPGT